MDNPDDQASVWWRFPLAAAAAALAVAFAPGASEWWEFATVAVLGACSLVLAGTGIRILMTRRRPRTGHRAPD